MANTSPSKSSAAANVGNDGEPVDKIQRGNYKFSTAGTATWIGLRVLDPFIQYNLLFRGAGDNILTRIGVTTTSSVLAGSSSALSKPRYILLGMSAAAVVKHIYWILGLNQEYFPPSFATFISAFNLAFDTTATFLLLSSKTSAALSEPQISIPYTNGLSLPFNVVVGTLMFSAGLLVETVAEVQRKWFKKDPKNKGKIFTGGLWRLARHINYGAYTIWRGGYMLAAGGWAPCVILMAFLLRDFLSNSIRGMDKYMGGKYSEQWEEYKARVPWLMFPGIF
ncbi:hypothetical protein DTO212C5_6161 [Paecilomyces variotii]|nr:hypothetical protein DTO212C5_6161 [Paecilomyces variotii]